MLFRSGSGQGLDVPCWLFPNGLQTEDGTGILRYMRDALTKKGLSVGAILFDINSISLIGEPGGTASPMILSNSGVTRFNEAPSSINTTASIALLNGKTEAESGVLAE